MFANLFPGEKVHLGDSVTLTLLGIEGDLIHFGVETCDLSSPSIENERFIGTQLLGAEPECPQ